MINYFDVSSIVEHSFLFDETNFVEIIVVNYRSIRTPVTVTSVSRHREGPLNPLKHHSIMMVSRQDSHKLFEIKFRGERGIRKKCNP